MFEDSLIIQKIADLVVEAQTGVKRPKIFEPQEALIMDSVTISDSGSATLRIREAMDSKDGERAAFVDSLKAKIDQNKYVFTDEAAEKIARHILGLKT